MVLNEHTIRAGAAAVAIWLALEQFAGAQNRPLSMRVVVYDYADTAPATLQQAQGIVSGIFREIDVDVAWLDQAEFGREMPAEQACRQAFVASVIYVSVLPPAMHKALGRKGSVLGGAGLNTRRIWISLSRVDRLAHWAKVAASDVLAQVLAHEIAHVLMPGDSHALTGLMQRALNPELIAHNQLSFGADEAQLIRTSLGAHSPAFRWQSVQLASAAGTNGDGMVETCRGGFGGRRVGQEVTKAGAQASHQDINTPPAAAPPPIVPAPMPGRPEEALRWPLVHFPDPEAAQIARQALNRATERLEQPYCRDILTDFTDGEGSLLTDRLATMDVDTRTYLRMITFVDDSRHSMCLDGVLGFTAPGSRVVRICTFGLKRTWSQDSNYVVAAFIHEILHTLGLRENPPSSKEITDRVLARCRQ